MSTARPRRNFLSWLRLFPLLFLSYPSVADVGTAGYYGPPYLPTACYGGDSGQFPADNLFAAAGEGIWDNGAACGRQYMVRCISSPTPGACIDMDKKIRVVVLDQGAAVRSAASRKGSTLLLSKPAFQTVASPSAPLINIEFVQV